MVPRWWTFTPGHFGFSSSSTIHGFGVLLLDAHFGDQARQVTVEYLDIVVKHLVLCVEDDCRGTFRECFVVFGYHGLWWLCCFGSHDGLVGCCFF
jgi:hypothetical protein